MPGRNGWFWVVINKWVFVLTHLLISFSNNCGFNWTYRALRAFPVLHVRDRSRYTNWEPTSVGVRDMRAVRDIRLDLRVQDRSLYNNWAPISVGVRDMRAVRYVRQPFWMTLSQAHVDRHRFTFPASTAGSAWHACSARNVVLSSKCLRTGAPGFG